MPAHPFSCRRKPTLISMPKPLWKRSWPSFVSTACRRSSPLIVTPVGSAAPVDAIFLPLSVASCSAWAWNPTSVHPSDQTKIVTWKGTIGATIQECLQVHRPTTLQEVRALTEQFLHHYNSERPHQGRSCKDQPPRVAFPTLPQLPPLPEQVDPDAWLQHLHGQAFARRIGADGCVDVDLEPYYIGRALAKHAVVLLVNAPEKRFDVYLQDTLIKQVPIKGLRGEVLPFERYVELIKLEARSEQRRLLMSKPSVRQM